MEQKHNKRTFSYEPFIAGAILKFGSIDNVDFSLLVEDFEKKTNVKFENSWYAPIHKLRRYYNTQKDGTVSLSDEISLDDYLEEYGCTLRKLLEIVAGKEVLDYFNGFSLQDYYASKEKAIQENKSNVLDNANVLLISDIPEDYEELKRYGFKNIDCFRSIVRADDYFSRHPEELQKYHIVLKGRQRVQDCCFEGDVELDGKIRALHFNTHILNANLYSYQYSDHTDYVSYLYDEYSGRDWTAKEHSYSSLFDRIVENTLINNTMENIGPKDFKPIKDSVNPNRLPLPKKKRDLKILYLDSVRVCKYADDIAKRLGLNVTFLEDNNSSLGKYVKRHLGDYDIIIASSLYSDNILGMADESTEQCKDSGRDLTLLVTYNDNTISQVDEDYVLDCDGIGSSIKLYYAYGSNMAPDNKVRGIEFRVLRKGPDFMLPEDAESKFFENEVSCMSGILSAAVNAYNSALLQANHSIDDLDFTTIDQFDAEYDLADKKEIARKEAALEPIRRFDRIRNAVSDYLYYRRRGLIKEAPEGLRIIEGKDGITVEFIHDGVIFCTVTYPKKYKHDNLRVFDIQTLSKKGKLLNPETVGLYTRKYEGYNGIPKRPDDRQENALIALEKKIDFALRPLNSKAWDRQNKREEKKPFVYAKKKRGKKD